MATLVLSAVGTIVGGPLGGAIGAIIGQQVDQEIFKPKGRKGPRLNELAVQTSSYGSAIPKLFGTMRVAGTVIWATDLREERKKSGGGKGRPSTTTYSYSVSFAVLLSARPIRQVRRIWADGNLLRGAAGDFKTPTGFRLFLGGEDQPVDPLIASAEGMANTPAFRGCAYAVFEDFALADYGNRIPSLSFEVEADGGPVPVGAIIDAIGGEAVRGSAARQLGGFAAVGDSLRGVVESLSVATPLSLVDEGVALLLTDAPGTAEPIGESDMQADAGERKRDERSLAAAAALPSEVSVSYYEPVRDYQAGVQRARRTGPGRRVERIDLPAALSSGEAKRAAEAELARIWSQREARTLRLAPRRIDIAPGQLVMIEGEPGLWRVGRRTIDRMMVELGLVKHRSTSAPAPQATPGRSVAPPDRPHGPTTLHVMDLPALGDELLSAPRLLIAAAGGPGWRRASLLSSLDGTRWEPVGPTAAPATIGTAMTALGSACAYSFDRLNSIEVQLLHDGMLLEDADDAALVAGANLALVGDELIQFGSAAPFGAGVWRLSRLTRGRRGTEAAIAGHVPGERFVLLEPETLLAFDPPLAALGGQAFILATGVGDAPQGVEAVCGILGQAVRPPRPVALTARTRADGGFDLSWTRRSRAGWAWLSGGDAPLGEELERYLLRIVRGDGSARELSLSGPVYLYAQADVAVDASLGSAVTISVAQQGSAARSGEATLTLSIG